MPYDDGLWSIGELAERAGVTVKTVRFYSDRGLLPETSRSAGGHRRYGPAALGRLALIRALRGLGLGVPEVRRVLPRGGPSDGVPQDEVLAEGLLEDAVDGQLRELGSQLTALRWREAALRLVRECPPGERADRLRLVGAVTTPPSTAAIARFWRGWLPARMPARAVAAFLDVAVPQPPADPEPAQVLAFARLHALTSRPCTGTEQPQPEAHRRAGGARAGVLYAGLAEAYDLAAAPLRAGRAPHPGEALDGFVSAYAQAYGTRDTPAFRRALAPQLAADPRLDEYWHLITALDPHSAPTPGTAHDWLLRSLHTETAPTA
ncbi:MerR family transcriptional regulator [Streptomyces sp. NBC_00670]|uniref:MerR family transcriptional regulator n=1 Tax=Streptomyces sp. NBC_00670 TaxID=2975804 RepID=UPI002E37F274|nr:MerR family transcriptional regulator [Streptomyces sp. NBC_00670]